MEHNRLSLPLSVPKKTIYGLTLQFDYNQDFRFETLKS